MIMMENITDDFHIADAIYTEILKGFYYMNPQEGEQNMPETTGTTIMKKFSGEATAGVGQVLRSIDAAKEARAQAEKDAKAAQEKKDREALKAAQSVKAQEETKKAMEGFSTAMAGKIENEQRMNEIRGQVGNDLIDTS